tara:strand:+ start:65 stop:244 length:180 start_codon:yes stop_codon:yes gene_type:complete
MEVKKNKKNKVLSLNKKLKCPTCKKLAVEKFSPFCSKKCASLDLTKWLLDEYQINIKSD